jgi:hypothetical protein
MFSLCRKPLPKASPCMLSWFYYRGSEHDRRSSLANQWNTYRYLNRLLCIADPAGRLGRSLTSWPEYSRNLEGFCWYKSAPGGTPPPSGTVDRLEHSHPEDPVRSTTDWKSLGLTMPLGHRLDARLLEVQPPSVRNVDCGLESSHSCTTARMTP